MIHLAKKKKKEKSGSACKCLINLMSALKSKQFSSRSGKKNEKKFIRVDAYCDIKVFFYSFHSHLQTIKMKFELKAMVL